MSYVVPVTFVGGTSVTDTDINLANDALRKYINKDIVSADLGTDVFGTTEIIKGEYQNVVPDHQFTTGDLYTQGEWADDVGGNRQYYSSTIKTVLGDDVPVNGQWGQIGQFNVIADTGKSIYFEANNNEDINLNAAGKIIITGHIGVRNYHQYVYNTDYLATSGNETRFYLLYKAEGISNGWLPLYDTKGQVLGFESYDNMTGGTSNDGTDSYNDRRVIPFLFELDIANFWATSIAAPYPKPQTLAWRFAIGVESSIDLGWVSNRYMTYEVFYC